MVHFTYTPPLFLYPLPIAFGQRCDTILFVKTYKLTTLYVSARVRSIIKSDNIVPYIKERVKVMSTKYSIAGYCRISVDEEMDRDNTSIENQKLS